VLVVLLDAMLTLESVGAVLSKVIAFGPFPLTVTPAFPASSVKEIAYAMVPFVSFALVVYTAV
jgi:hypothetical protein